MPPAPRTRTDPLAVQPPRPPNAWILYRSDKIRDLPPVPPGAPRRPQAEVSRLLAALWKNESPQVKAEYERRAEAKKAEHHIQFPDYSFKPLKKEEKERLREERRKAKSTAKRVASASHDAQSASTSQIPTTSGSALPGNSLYPVQIANPASIYGAAGPSPPMSAASSPDAYSLSRQVSQPSAPTQPLHFPHYQPESLATQPPQAPPASASTDAPTMHTVVLPWNPPFPQNFSTDLAQADANNDQLSISLPASCINPSNSFAQGPTSLFSQDDFHSFLLGTTDNPEIFQVGQFAPLVQEPYNNGTELEVQMGQSGFDPSQIDFSGFDFNQWIANASAFNTDSLIAPEDATASSSSRTTSNPEYMNQFFDFQFDDTTAGFNNTSMFEPNMMDQDTASCFTTPESSQSIDPLTPLSAYQSPSPLTEQPVSYQPPAGAAHSSTRRVAATWKKPPTGTAPQPWGVPAS